VFSFFSLLQQKYGLYRNSGQFFLAHGYPLLGGFTVYASCRKTVEKDETPFNYSLFYCTTVGIASDNHSKALNDRQRYLQMKRTTPRNHPECARILLAHSSNSKTIIVGHLSGYVSRLTAHFKHRLFFSLAR